MGFGAAQGNVATSVLPEVMPSPDLSDFAPNDPTKGDLLAGDGANWDDLAVGADGLFLTADSGEAQGVKWAAAAPASHDLLSATHGDTTAAAVVRGDIVVGQTATPKWERLALGVANRVLRSDGTDAAWAQVALATDVSGILPVANGGTGVTTSTGTTNVVLSGSPTIVTPTIASFTNATHDHSNAAGGGTLNASAIAAGTLAVARGGTGLATYVIGDLIIASAATTLISLADVATGNAVISGGVGVVPSYGKIGLTTHISGTLAVANGGTGVTSSTGTTNVVLSGSPTIVTPTIASFTNAGHNHEAAAGGGTLDHGLALTGLTDDDHTIYALLAGRSGGQILIGGTGAGDDLTLRSTSNATDGDVIFQSDPTSETMRIKPTSITFTVSNITPAVDSGSNLGTSSLRYSSISFANQLNHFESLGDANPSFSAQGSSILFGAGGASGLDIQLGRGAADMLELVAGDSFRALSGSIRAGGTGGTAVAFFEMDDGATVGVGAAGEVRMRSNGGTFEVSENAGAFAAPGGGVTLDGAYDFGGAGAGAKIIADSGEVIITIDDGSLPSRSANTVLVIANTSAAGDSVEMSLISGTSGECHLNLGDTSNEDVAGIRYFHSSNVMNIIANSTTVLDLSSSECTVNQFAGGLDFRVEGESLQRLLATDASAATENVVLLHNTAPDFKTMDRGIAFGNVSQAPTSDPVGGGFLYVVAGALTWRGSSGNIETIAIA